MVLCNEQASLLYYCKGLLVMLRECCSARNIHQVRNIETVLTLWVSALEKGVSPGLLKSIQEKLPGVAERVRLEYSSWWKINHRKGT